MGSKLSKLNHKANKTTVTPVPTSYEDDINETTQITPSTQPNVSNPTTSTKTVSKWKSKILV